MKLTTLALIFLVGGAAGWLAGRLRLPGLLGMLLAGWALGPHGCRWLAPEVLAHAAELRQLALVIILVRVGLALELRDLKKIGLPALLLGILPGAAELGGCVLLAPPLLGISRLEGALIGAMLGAVSLAVLAPRLLRLREEGEARVSPLLLAASSLDNVFALSVFGVVLGVLQHGGTSSVAWFRLPLALVGGVAAGGLCGLLAGWLLRRFRSGTTSGVLLVLSVAVLFPELERWGFFPGSGLLGVVSVGVVLKQVAPGVVRKVADGFNQLWRAAEILLFVLIGAALDPGVIGRFGPVLLLLLGGALGFRLAGTLVALAGGRLPRPLQLYCLLAELPKATVQAAVGAIPLSLGLPCGELVLAAAVLATLITAPVGALALDRGRRLLGEEGGSGFDRDRT